MRQNNLLYDASASSARLKAAGLSNYTTPTQRALTAQAKRLAGGENPGGDT
jgi:hypothetical protein